MKKHILLIFLMFSAWMSAQVTPINDQIRFNSDSRQFFMWNKEKDGYDLKDTEIENSLIDIREIGSKSSGYIIISLSDNGSVRTYHGSIINYIVDADGNSVWVMRSKNARGKLFLEPKKKTLTYSYESNDERYTKIFVFNIASDEPGTD